MRAPGVTVEWRKGETGTGGTYTFSPKPFLTRNFPTQKTAVLDIPLLSGSVVQLLGTQSRSIGVSGKIVLRSPSYDDLVAAKKALEDGIGSTAGQLHLISNSGASNARHVYYKGIVDNGIQWAEQQNMVFLDYRFTILCADPSEYYYGMQSVIYSNARIQ